jgi:hypothetical protein
MRYATDRYNVHMRALGRSKRRWEDNHKKLNAKSTEVRVQHHVPAVYPMGALDRRLVGPQTDMDVVQERPLLLYRIEPRFAGCPIRSLVAIPTEFKYIVFRVCTAGRTSRT